MKQEWKAEKNTTFSYRTISIAVLAVVCAVAAMFVLSSCSLSRTPITTDQFISQMEAKDYSIVDATDQYESGVFDNVTIGVKDGLQVEYYDCQSKEQAVALFEGTQKIFEGESTGNASHSSLSAGNYNTFTQSSDSQYWLVSQTDDTVIYCKCPASGKETAESIVKELGYL